MVRPHIDEQNDGLIALVKETADGLGRLIADHINLARLEIVADAKTYSRRVGLMTLAGVFVALGYLFAALALALALGRLMGSPLAFLAVGAVHLIGGILGVSTVLRRLKNTRILDETASEVGRTVATLATDVAGRSDGPRASSSP
jgi:hypothetical protein